MNIASMFAAVKEKIAKFKNDCDKSNGYFKLRNIFTRFYANFFLYFVLLRCLFILTWLAKSITRLSSRRKWFAMLSVDTRLRRLQASLTSRTRQLEDGCSRKRKRDI